MDKNSTILPEEFEEIERYLLQQMPADEQAAFEQKLATNSTIKNKVQQVQLLMLGIKEVALEKSLNRFQKTLPATNNRLIKTSRVLTIRHWLAAASVLLILATGSWWLLFKKSLNEQLYTVYFQPDPGLITAMSSSDNYVFDKAMVDYKTGKYETAIAAWKGLQQRNPTSDTLNYFIGAALLANSNSNEAVSYLKSVTEVNNSSFQKDAFWYIGLALIEQNRLQEAAKFISFSDRPEKDALLKQLK